MSGTENEAVETVKTRMARAAAVRQGLIRDIATGQHPACAHDDDIAHAHYATYRHGSGIYCTHGHCIAVVGTALVEGDPMLDVSAAFAQALDTDPGDLNAALWAALEVHKAVIAREVIAGVCEREGHRAERWSTLAEGVWSDTCERCGTTWPLPKLGEPEPATQKVPAPGLVLREPTPQARFADPGQALPLDRSKPEGFLPLPSRRPVSRETALAMTRATAERMRPTFDRLAEVEAAEQRAATAAAEADMVIPTSYGIPAPEPCPFACGTGPLGRDQLIAHIAQAHPDARAAQSVLGGDDPREGAR